MYLIRIPPEHLSLDDLIGMSKIAVDSEHTEEIIQLIWTGTVSTSYLTLLDKLNCPTEL